VQSWLDFHLWKWLPQALKNRKEAGTPCSFHVLFAQRIGLALLLALTLSGCDRGSRPSQVATPAPNFSITDGAKTIRLSDYRGKIVVLNFWASWCAPCIEELPSLNALQRQMPQIVVLGVNFNDDASAYQQFLSDHHVTFQTIHDESQKSNLSFGTTRPPETYIIDGNGIIRRKFIGPQDWTSPEIINYLKNLS